MNKYECIDNKGKKFIVFAEDYHKVGYVLLHNGVIDFPISTQLIEEGVGNKEEGLMNTHGGVRDGAGRKRSGRSATLSITIKPENKEYLEQRAKETGLTVTEVLEAIIETFIDDHKK